VALPNHRFTVVSLDGNPVPSPQPVETVFLAPAERADAIVEMNRPGVWVLGSIKEEDRNMGLGTVIEYANQRGEPVWSGANPTRIGITTRFGAARALPNPDERLELVFEKVPRWPGRLQSLEQSTASRGRNTSSLFTTEQGKRYPPSR